MRTFLFFFFSAIVFAQTPKVSSGKIIEHVDFKSNIIGQRTVRVWLPYNYSPKRKHQVLYVNDGQMLWDANITWNKQEWKLDETLSKLLKEKKIKPTIVVAVDNAGKNRHSEYFPQKPFESLSQKTQDSLYSLYRNKDQTIYNDKVYSDNYLKFLVEELKPFIDQNYSTYKDASNTFIMGSSMGGLISMYAVCEYPKVFGGNLSLSTHWPGVFATENNPIPGAFMKYLQKSLPDPNTHKLYFDYGTETLDALYEPYQLKADEIIKAKGYTNKNWKSLKFSGKDHSEKAWAERLDIPLVFMLK